MKALYSILAAACVLLALPAAPLAAVPITFTEDFSSAQYRDGNATTADWDVATHTLHLPPFAPSDAGAGDTPGSARRLVVCGRYAFVADYDQGISVFDIVDPSQAVLVASLDTPGYAIGLALRGNWLYVADGSEGIRVVDITDPTTPVLGAGVITTGYTNDVCVQGDLICVADGAAGFKTYVATNPAAPALLGAVDTPGYAYAVAVNGGHAYVADGAEGLRILDIGNPAVPTLAGVWDSPGTAYDVVVAGRIALIADLGRGLAVVDVLDPAAPALLGTRDTPGQARGVALDGDVAYVADGPNGLQVISVADPTNPTMLAGRDTPDYAYCVASLGEHAWVADGTAGLRGVRVRMAHPLLPVEISSSTWYSSYAMRAEGGLLFAGSGAGVSIYDITDPLHPVLAGEAENEAGSPALASGLAVRGGLVCATQGDSGVMLVDASNPWAPAFLGAVDTPGDARDVALLGNYALVAAGTGGIQVIDISTPTAPALVRTVPIAGVTYALDVEADLLCVTSTSGVRLYDVSNPSDPTYRTSVAGVGTCLDVALAGGYAYLAGGYAYAVYVVDVHDSSAPVLVNTIGTPLLGRVNVAGGYAVFTGGVGSTLQVYGLADPANPVLLDSRSVSSQPWNAVAYGDLVLVGEDEAFPYEVFAFAQRSVDTSRNLAVSLPRDFQIDSVVRGRLVTPPQVPIIWGLSVDFGQNVWQVQPGEWVDFEWSETAGFVFTAQLIYPDYGNFPVCSGVTVDWRYVHPVITSVADVPGDQGGQVRLRWVRSGYDDRDSDTEIVEYSVYRRYVGAAGPAGLRDASGTVTTVDKTWPPGQWDYLITVPADGEDSYSVVVPTLADSGLTGAAATTFFVRARTDSPGFTFDAPPDSGCSVDNLAPSAPSMFTVAYGISGNFLSWAPQTADGVDHYCVYRGTTSGFVPDAAHRVATPTIPSWIDHQTDPWGWSYQVSAVDRAGNEGPPVAPAGLTGVADGPKSGDQIRSLALRGAAPNPFNPATTLRYDVPSGAGDVSLKVFDVRGRPVRTLVSGHAEPGSHSLTWDGRDGSGHPVPSGVYFAQLRAAGRGMQVLKLTLTR